MPVVTLTTTTTTTSSMTVPSSSPAPAPLATARSTYRVSSAVLPPAPTTELSSLCADVRAVLHSQGELKTLLREHSVKLDKCTDFISSQKVHNVTLGNSIASLATEMNGKFETLTAEIHGKFETLTKNYVEVSSRTNSLETSLANLQAQFDQFKASSLAVLTPTVPSSPRPLNELSARIQRLEEDQTSCALLISGMPECRGENLSLLMLRIAEILEVPSSARDIVNVRRLPSNLSRSRGDNRASDKPRTILAKLCASSLKKTLLAARRQKVRLSANEVNSSFSDGLIRINDFLPKDSWLLLKIVRAAARERGYRYSWYSRGHVLVKKDSDSVPIRISSEKDIDSKMK